MHPHFYSALHRHGKDHLHLQELLSGRYGGNAHLLPLFESLYDKCFSNSPCHNGSGYQIPKKIHQVWLGKSIPCQYEPYMQTWAEQQGWQYRLWTDTDIEHCLKYNIDLYHLAKNYGEKSDIFRLEILYQEGGLYVDVDVECLNIDFFDHLHRSLTFYAGFEPLAHQWLGISNALFASAPGHPLLEQLIVTLRSHFFINENQFTVIKTGPRFITNTIETMTQKQKMTDSCIFPASYFHPASGEDIKTNRIDLYKESAALHHWSGSWLNSLL